MKTVNVALLALIISATSSPVVLAGDTIEAAATELSAINSGMSQSEIEQKITRFLERTDNSPAAYTYLTEHHYIPSETPDTTQTPPVQTDPDAGQNRCRYRCCTDTCPLSEHDQRPTVCGN